MTSVARRLAAGLALTLPATLLPTSLMAHGFDTTTSTAVVAVDDPNPARVVATPRAVNTRGEWRWRDYVAQKPRWKTSTCTKATLNSAAQMLPPKSGLRVECAVVRTPLSWADLTKGSIRLGITRLVVPATAGAGKSAPSGRRLILLNPGGPGMQAGPMVPTAVIKPATLRTHQFAAVDPRGTGLSTPVVCRTPRDTVFDQRVNPSRVWAATAAAARAFVADCVKTQGRYLPHLTTVNTVHDMNFARALMGYRTTDWYGASAGTWMGAWLTQLHPKSMGRVVLDANLQFTADWRTAAASQAMAFTRRYERQFLPWLARANRTYRLGSTAAAVRASYERIRAAAAQRRIQGLTPAQLDVLTLLQQYGDEQYPILAGVLADLHRQLARTGRAVARDVKPLLNDGSEAWTPAVRTAILCNDTPWPRGQASYRAAYVANARRYPMAAYGASEIACATWPYRGGPAPKIDGSGTPMMLMVQTELDPATPVEGARKAHAANRSTRLLFVDNQGSHGAFPTANACVDRYVTAYLTRGILPARDVTCPGIPLPGEKTVYEVGTD